MLQKYTRTSKTLYWVKDLGTKGHMLYDSIYETSKVDKFIQKVDWWFSEAGKGWMGSNYLINEYKVYWGLIKCFGTKEK